MSCPCNRLLAGITAELNNSLSKCCKEPSRPKDALHLLWDKVGVDLLMLDRQSFMINCSSQLWAFRSVRY